MPEGQLTSPLSIAVTTWAIGRRPTDVHVLTAPTYARGHTGAWEDCASREHQWANRKYLRPSAPRKPGRNPKNRPEIRSHSGWGPAQRAIWRPSVRPAQNLKPNQIGPHPPSGGLHPRGPPLGRAASTTLSQLTSVCSAGAQSADCT